MSAYLDEKYVGLLGPLLRNFKRKSSNVFNFSCPYCGDSASNSRKARGYVINRGQGWFYHCHNCDDHSKSVHALIKWVNPLLYDEYKIELMTEKYGERKVDEFEEFVDKMKKPRFIADTSFNDLKKVSQLKPGHPCKKYVDQRKIPSKFHHKLFYCAKFMEFTNTVIPDKFSEGALKYDGPRLVIPLLDKDKKLIGYTGRALYEDDAKYISIMLVDDKPKLWGLDDLHEDRLIYVFEGPIDAMMVPNSIAVCGGELNTVVKYFRKENVVLVFDNEPRHVITCKKLRAAILNDFKVVIWPSSILEKDPGKMVENGMPLDMLFSLIKERTFEGLPAQLEFEEWKK